MNGIMVLVAYAVLMIVATIVFAKRDKDSDSFYVGNRNMGTVSSAMSIAATWIWAPALFTSAEKAYLNGVPGLFWFLVPNILCLLIFIPFAKRIRKEMPNGITLSGYMHEKYRSEKVKGVYLFQLTMLTVLSTAVQLLAGGKILSVATGLPLWVMTIVLAVIAFSYSQISGIKASVLTDAIQMIFLLLACAIFVPWALKSNGGMSSIQLSGITGEFGDLFSKNGLQVFLGFGLPTAIIAQKPCSFGGNKFFIGEEVPAELVTNPKMQEKMGVIAIATDGGDIPKEELADMVATVGQVMFEMPIRQKGETMSLPLNEEQLSQAIEIMQMSTNDAKEAIKGLTDENVLILLNACDSRKAIKDLTESVAIGLEEAPEEDDAPEEESAGEE